ncbi:SsrA-binding protein [candidate division Kazan bacterium]|uniref:SsrA-binding protein n=1 Tax=candidate division Kazan bacterium TaxID=2202143 RepID=A0A420ZCW0_UNCK3|nr:MAG: SsrA-binding protein [candidate division Kazan bacterium]
MKIINPQAKFNYQILDTIEAGISLLGAEVKSVRAGQVSLKESFAKIKNKEIWLMGAHIAPYKQGTPKNYDPIRPRKLLLHKKEINHLIGKLNEQGLSLIPMKMYSKKNKIKLELGLGRGKKKYDKRASIKEREFKRTQQRVLKYKKRK